MIVPGEEEDVDYVNVWNRKVLSLLASWNSHFETVKVLLEAGADVNLQDSGGKTALMFGDEYPEIVSVLREAGATE